MNAAAVAERERREYEAQQVVRGAWLAAALHRQRRLPRLEKLLRGPAQVKKTGRDEVRREWEELQAVFGKSSLTSLEKRGKG